MTGGLETVARGTDSHIVQPRQVLARDATEWLALWTAHSGPESPAPPVDFETRIVAAVFAGQRPTSGFDIAVTGSRRDGAALVLNVEEHRPEEGAILAQTLTSPFHIVTLPRYDGQVRFAPDNGFHVSPSVASTSGRRRHEPAPSSTGLPPSVAASLAYLAGPLSGALLLGVERTSRFVRFHAWQAVLALGAVGVLALLLLGLAFGMLVVSPAAFWTMLWLAAISAALWVGIWASCLVQAYRGRLWKLPIAGDYAQRRAGIIR